MRIIAGSSCQSSLVKYPWNNFASGVKSIYIVTHDLVRNIEFFISCCFLGQGSPFNYFQYLCAIISKPFSLLRASSFSVYQNKSWVSDKTVMMYLPDWFSYIEIFKFKKSQSNRMCYCLVLFKSAVTNYFYSESEAYRNNSWFKRRRVKSVWHDTESVSYLGPKIWDLLPNEIKESESLNGFKFKIKRWVPERCPCRICKLCLGQVVFIVT